MTIATTPMQWILGCILILSSLGIILARKPMHASLSFLLSLITLAAFYLSLSAEFIAVMQILVYAGAILVIFIFVIVLFQDAHAQLDRHLSRSSPILLLSASVLFPSILMFLAYTFMHDPFNTHSLPQEFGTAQAIGRDLYTNFFFPFEIVSIVFLIAMIGVLYIARKES